LAPVSDNLDDQADSVIGTTPFKSNDMQLLAISGSLRAESTNTALLRELQRFTPGGVEVVLYAEMGELPIFNPDLEGSRTPSAVLRLARQVSRADGLVVCSPEYVHGIPGGLKNLFDWLTSRAEVVDKRQHKR
jgi:chromate reductase